MKKVYLLLLFFTTCIVAESATIYVSSTGNDANAGTSCTDAKQTITAAIAAASSGDIIHICAGNYTITSDIAVNKSLTIVGNGGFPNARPILTMGTGCKSIFVVDAVNVTITNLHLQVNGLGSTFNDGRHGIFVNHVYNGTNYNNLTITYNLIENINSFNNLSPIDMGAFGIRLARQDVGAELTDANNQITIQNNIIFSAASANLFRVAIRSIGNYGNISNNQIINAGLYGIQWGDIKASSNISSNTINFAREAGIEVNIPVNASVVNINNNTISTVMPNQVIPGFAGIEVKDSYIGSTVNVHNNSISGDYAVGIWVGRSSNVNIVSNTFTHSTNTTAYYHVALNTKNRTIGMAGPAITSQNISIRSNIFNGTGTNDNGTGIIFANHHSGAVPPFSNITLGTSTEPNFFGANGENLRNFIVLDAYYGPSDAMNLNLPLGNFPNPYFNVWGTFTNIPQTQMASVTTNIYARYNVFNLGNGNKVTEAFAVYNDILNDSELIALENKIQHTIDYGPLGFVTVRDWHVYVTQNSYISPAFTVQPRIRRGTNVINADGFTLNVQAGIYNDDGSATDRPLTQYNMNFYRLGLGNVQSENWEMNGTNKTLNLLSDLTINNQVIFNDGYIQTNSNTLIFTPNATDPVANPATIGEKDYSRIIGRARTTRAVGTNAFNFLGLNLPAGNDIDTLDLLRVSGPAGIQAVGPFTSIACTWYLNPSIVDSRNGATFSWLSAINNGKNVNQLQGWRYNGTEWETTSPIFAASSVSGGFGTLYTSIAMNISASQLNPLPSPWTISDIVNPLPVEFLNIQARYNESHIPEIVWNTLNEINTDVYEVERSINAREFVKVGQVFARRQSQNLYIFEDSRLTNKYSEKLYYRIKQIDKDGRFTYSRIVSLSNVKNNLTLSIYPNPVRNELFVNALQENLQVKIQNLQGKVLHQSTLHFGENTLKINNLPQGVYLLCVEGKQEREIHKIVKH